MQIVKKLGDTMAYINNNYNTDEGNDAADFCTNNPDRGTCQVYHHHHHVSIRFYQMQLVATMSWWILVRMATGRRLDVVTYGSVATRPSWISRRTMHRLQHPDVRKYVFLASLIALGLAGPLSRFFAIMLDCPFCFLAVRVLVALSVSVYHLVETSLSHRHGEYPVLYNVWAMCLPNSDYAHAASWGIAIHFIICTGWAKIVVGGRGEWLSPSTMQFYLTVYANARSKLSQPLLPSLNRWICSRPWASKLISAFTLWLECVLVPSTLFLIPPRRSLASLGLIGMHVGILGAMSKQVGLAFFTTLPAYVIGFQCTAELWSGPWWLALTIAFGPNTVQLILSCLCWYCLPSKRRHWAVRVPLLLPEDWPCSPISLFMWSGHQAKRLSETLMTKHTRVVMGTADKTALNIVGLPVVHHGATEGRVSRRGPAQHDDSHQRNATGSSNAVVGVVDGDEVVVHDCVLRVIGFTLLLLQRDDHLAEFFDEWEVGPFVDGLSQFLKAEQRLFETQSGQPLVNAYFVAIDENRNVIQVLHGVK